MEATYTPGDGLVVGAGSRWLLVADDPGPDQVERLWTLLTGPRTDAVTVLATVAEVCDPDRGLVLVDLTLGAETSVTRGPGRHTTLDGVHTLTLGDAVPAPVGRRLVGGTVSAGALRLQPASRPAPVTVPAASPPPDSSPASSAGLIDGIPDDILAAVATAPPAMFVPPVEVPAAPVAPVADDHDDPPTAPVTMLERLGSTARRDPLPGPAPEPAPALHDTDHDGRTSYRPEDLTLLPPGPPPSGPPIPGPPPTAPPTAPPTVPPTGSHLTTSDDTVLAVHCPEGHVTAAYTPRCRVCDTEVAPQEPRRVPRPRLGLLHLPDGESLPLDRGVVLGRQPDAVPGSDWPHLVRLPSDNTFVSRSHLSIELDGWLVLATDLGSRGGTTLRVAGRAPVRIRAHERYVWEPGQVLDLADSYEIVFEVTE